MLHKVKASHGDILRGLPELTALLPSSERKKKLLLEMARKGEPKPKRKTASSSALSSYATKSSNYYDPKFAREIRRLAPHWFKKKPL